MKTEISYKHITNIEEKQEKAIADVKEYLTEKQFIFLQNLLMTATSYAQFSLFCLFVGVTGYPVIAMFNIMKQTMRDMTN